MTWLSRMLTWLMTNRIRIGELPPAKTQRDYDEEQRKLADVWQRIATAGHGYREDRVLNERTAPDDQR